MSSYQELQSLGAKKVYKPNVGYVFRVSRTPYGNYFLCERHGYHHKSERKYIDRSQCPTLFAQLSGLEQEDNIFYESGGRVFVGQLGVFR